ncbi:MerR family DNA-binding transcriptional regulator [Lysinibacter sp. HNR]|uniref:MerR family DNA-binding transcriptional regulator n=1 Tax=Lysinibacter sp. HNR TaxID=3031408 RepID=UPI0024359CAA|nr:MerR family DNA-binding transcriptional regulator [Lysinibacter sp. HNR]WGD36872.1 redoxin family protein [Lysinibacter sp. HNR]
MTLPPGTGFMVLVGGKMRIGELAQRAGVSVKAVRYYEQLGLIEPSREANGYRSFSQDHLRAVVEIRRLNTVGISPLRAAPFIECLDNGHQHGDECVSSLAVYRDAIAELNRIIDALSERRTVLQERLHLGANKTFKKEDSVTDPVPLPQGLPIPEDDGAADHLPGTRMPELTLATSDGGSVDLSRLGPGRTVIYLYPLTGRPGVDLPEGWDAIPGARGCSTEACDFRDHFEVLREAGISRVFGFSSQEPSYQAELVSRLRLPFTMISDGAFALAEQLRLPTFAAPDHDRLYARLTLIVSRGMIEHVFYPIFPPNTHAQQVLTWLEANPR